MKIERERTANDQRLTEYAHQMGVEMRNARSQPLGATRFALLRILRDLKIYEDRITAHRWESQLLEEESRSQLQKEQEASQLLAIQKTQRILQQRLALDQMTPEQRTAWQWEENVISWLTSNDPDETSEGPVLTP